MAIMKCKHCKKPFTPRRQTKQPQKYCSPNCRTAHNNAKNKLLSGKEYKRLLKIEAEYNKIKSPQFLRYLKYESRISAWLKANKK